GAGDARVQFDQGLGGEQGRYLIEDAGGCYRDLAGIDDGQYLLSQDHVFGVLKHHEVVGGDGGVGGEEIHDVDGAISQGCDGQGPAAVVDGFEGRRGKAVETL